MERVLYSLVSLTSNFLNTFVCEKVSLGTRDIAVNQIDKVLPSWSLHSSRGVQIEMSKQISNVVLDSRKFKIP